MLKNLNIYRRFVVVILILIGKTVTEASNLIRYNRHFGGRWFKEYKKTRNIWFIY